MIAYYTPNDNKNITFIITHDLVDFCKFNQVLNLEYGHLEMNGIYDYLSEDSSMILISSKKF